ncbi:MAG: DUF3568 domain-containing protein [Syntrophales bacterium]|nr:DUF3568 domain-containing protein [Syntrophales bacterium]MDY0044214.1 DUF3568 family protein [Syntrophales bacterium]
MNRRTYTLLLVIYCVFIIAGCNTAFMVGDKVVGVRSGKFFYTDGALRTNYHAAFEKVWDASQKALSDMNATIKDVEKKIAKGSFDAVVEGESVKISIKYIEYQNTMVSVRVGLSGNSLASKLIHEKIKENLSGLQT